MTPTLDNPSDSNTTQHGRDLNLSGNDLIAKLIRQHARDIHRRVGVLVSQALREYDRRTSDPALKSPRILDVREPRPHTTLQVTLDIGAARSLSAVQARQGNRSVGEVVFAALAEYLVERNLVSLDQVEAVPKPLSMARSIKILGNDSVIAALDDYLHASHERMSDFSKAAVESYVVRIREAGGVSDVFDAYIPGDTKARTSYAATAMWEQLRAISYVQGNRAYFRVMLSALTLELLDRGVEIPGLTQGISKTDPTMDLG